MPFVQTNLDQTNFKTLKHHAISKGIPLKELARTILLEWLTKNKEKELPNEQERNRS